MPIKKEPWPQGTPAWVDLMTGDFEATKAFYRELFGWEYDESGEEYGHYATAALNGEPVAGIGPTQGPDAPPSSWTTYLAVDDAAATVATAAAAGATVLVPVMEIGAMGSMAVLADPTGAVFGVWQSGQHTGFDLYNEPGSDVWNEAMVADYKSGKDFYAQVFGYTYTEIGDENFSYATVELGGETIGGIGVADDPPHWNTYFDVADAAAACDKATGLGADIVTPLSTSPYGITAELRAPGGELLRIIQPPAEASG
jgi:predicted enzyme related to lactoylglutathione lyase